MTSPQEARRLVGQQDIVDRLNFNACACDLDHYDFDMATDQRDAADEIERLRTALRAVRASTCSKWQALLIAEALREAAPRTKEVEVGQWAVITNSGEPCDSFHTRESAERYREYCDGKGHCAPYAVIHLTGKATVKA